MIAVVQYRDVLVTVARRGEFDTAAGVPEIGAVVWSLFLGAVAFVGGRPTTQPFVSPRSRPAGCVVTQRAAW